MCKVAKRYAEKQSKRQREKQINKYRQQHPMSVAKVRKAESINGHSREKVKVRIQELCDKDGSYENN